MKPDSIRHLLKDAEQQLAASSESPLLDAELLLASCIDKNRAYLLAWEDIVPTPDQLETFKQNLEKRLSGIPVAYLLGYKEFWTLKLKVTPAVLIPRPETELLVETAIEKLSEKKQLQILDLGTGSGAIALALAQELPDAEITAVEQSKAALEIARFNKEKYQLSNVTLIASNWFQSIPSKEFDLIVSNPPYIEERDPHLKGDIQHEPLEALTSGKDGLDDIRLIIGSAQTYLKPEGILMLEHGYNQAKATAQLMLRHSFKNIATLKDYSQLDRITLGYHPNTSYKLPAFTC